MLVSCFFLLSSIRACAVGTTTRICCRQTDILVPRATRLNLTKKRRALGTRMANGLSQTSRSLSLTKRIAASGNEIGSLHAVYATARAQRYYVSPSPINMGDRPKRMSCSPRRFLEEFCQLREKKIEKVERK